MNEMSRTHSAYGRIQKCIQSFSWKILGKIPLRRPGHIRELNIKMDFKEVGCDPRKLIDLAEDRNRWRTYIRAVINLFFKSQLISLL